MPLPVFDLGVPGPQRDHLVTQVLSGEKVEFFRMVDHGSGDGVGAV